MSHPPYPIEPGSWDQGGAVVSEHGVNFSVYCRYAERLEAAAVRAGG